MESAESKPVDTLDALFAWHKPHQETARDLAARSPPISGQLWVESGRTFDSLHTSRSDTPTPRTLVCHDFRGGYNEDRFVRGAECVQEPYVFRHWSGIDVFVYFSHHFVTVPPFGWIESAHRHGVQVLGTIITEWDDGAAKCSEMLASERSIDAFVAKCEENMLAENFDGWLLNIENRLSEDEVLSMAKLVKKLTESVHRVRPGGLVIWYDSVTIEGKLAWQNALNAKNKLFFDACDGIFLNYNWKEDDLKSSVDILKEDEGPDRLRDIYVGLDVFGRGCLGGFKTAQAMETVRAKGLSAAIFAPGWTLETAADAKSNFLDREYAFWRLLERHLFFRGPKIVVKENETSTMPVCLFSSRFSSGCSRKNEQASSKVKEGNEKCELAFQVSNLWLDLRRQEFQPSFLSQPEWPKEVVKELEPERLGSAHDFCVFADNSDEYGKGRGMCVQLTREELGDTTVPLLCCDLSNKNGVNLVFEVGYSFGSCSDEKGCLEVVLSSKTKEGVQEILVLKEQDVNVALKLPSQAKCNNSVVFNVPKKVESIDAVGIRMSCPNLTVIIESLSIYQLPHDI